MPVIRFTDLSLSKLSAEKQTRYVCAALPNFGIIVGKRKKTFFVMHGKDRRIQTLGKYPAVTLKAARSKALAIIDGTHVIQAAQAPKARVEEYIRSLNHATPRYNYEQKRLLERHLLPHVTDLSKTTKSDILKITDFLVDRPSEQLHFCRAVKAFFNWLVRRDYIQTSPVNALTAPQGEKTRDRVLGPWELELIWQKAVGSYGAIIRLCILLGTRKGETTALRSEWIQENTVVIPASVTKNRTEHILPLTDRAKRLAERYAKMPRPNWNSWNKEKKNMNTEWQDSIHKITDWTIHDLRRTFATIHAQIGTPPHIIERLLNHKSGVVSGVSAIYNRYHYLPQMREALEAYERYLEPRIFKDEE